ncbi:hypothetical protein PGB90_007537 [Kerria lacca]
MIATGGDFFLPLLFHYISKEVKEILVKCEILGDEIVAASGIVSGAVKDEVFRRFIPQATGAPGTRSLFNPKEIKGIRERVQELEGEVSHISCQVVSVVPRRSFLSFEEDMRVSCKINLGLDGGVNRGEMWNSGRWWYVGMFQLLMIDLVMEAAATERKIGGERARIREVIVEVVR